MKKVNPLETLYLKETVRKQYINVEQFVNSTVFTKFIKKQTEHFFKLSVTYHCCTLLNPYSDR